MVSKSVTNGLIQFSCILSMIGSALVVFTWYYPKENRTKHGRILLLWLSIADFLSSLFYIVQTFDNVTDNQSVCEALSLLDIYFPVASFLWTDFIAYYLYLVVQNRTASYAFSWKKLLTAFHITAWSVSLLVVFLVLFTHHAGHGSDDTTDDDNLDNTGGWCWIEASNKKERFVWELVGGKIIEWISGLIIVPTLYIFVALRLYQIDKRQIRTTSSALNLNANKKSFLSTVSGPEDADVMNAMRNPPLNFAPSSSNSEANAKVNGDPEDVSDMDSREGSQRMGYEDDSMRYSNYASDYGNSAHEMSSLDSLQSVIIEEDEDDDESREFSFNGPSGQAVTQTPHGVRITGNKGKYFNRFYGKLFLLPLVFIFVRFWSSLRVILIYFDERNAANNGFLAVMQAFFDPSQGFFNSILFVFFSKSDRNRLVTTFRQLGHQLYLLCCTRTKHDENNPKNFRLETFVSNNSPNRRLEPAVGRPTSVVGGVGVSLPSNLKENLVNNALHSDAKVTKNPMVNKSSFSRKSDASEEIPIEDIEGEYECDDENRLSDFSFDSRMDSISAPATSFSNAPRLDA